MFLNKKTIIFLVLNTLLTLLFAGIYIYIFFRYYSFISVSFIILSVLGLLFYIINSIFIIFFVSKLETINLKLNEANEKIKSMQEFQDKAKALKHDFANILQGMEGYIENKDLEGLKKYNSQFIEDTTELNSLAIFTSDIINNPAIYSVLSQKYKRANEFGIKLNFDIMLNLNTLNMKIFEFTRILGILMDNAIEASKECDEKFINISILENTKKHMQILNIQNTYNDININTEKIFEKGYSTKENNSGYGLWEVRQIIKKNKNLNLFTTKNEKIFTQQLEIYLN